MFGLLDVKMCNKVIYLMLNWWQDIKIKQDIIVGAQPKRNVQLASKA